MLCPYQVGVKMELLKLGPHISVASAVVSAALGKVREDLTRQVPTGDICLFPCNS